MSGFRASALVAVASVLALARPVPTEAGDGYVVVVNQANPVHRMSRADLSKLFLKRTANWPGGAVVVPFDLSGASPTRKAFTQGVHGKPLWVVVAFWQQEIASGRSQPPPVCATEEAALQAVSGDPGAVAYVSEALTLSPGVKVLTVEP
jgi:ABC-type phosphate transport system substrate-binding protein